MIHLKLDLGIRQAKSGNWIKAVAKNAHVFRDRLLRVQVVSRDAVKVVRKWDSPRTLFYCDPPYLHEARAAGSRNVYGVELSEEDHRGLAEALQSCTGKAVLSGYPSDLYAELYGGWRVVDFDLPNNAAGGKTKRRMWMPVCSSVAVFSDSSAHFDRKRSVSMRFRSSADASHTSSKPKRGPNKAANDPDCGFFSAGGVVAEARSSIKATRRIFRSSLSACNTASSQSSAEATP